MFTLFPLLSLSRKLLLFVMLVDSVQYDFQMVIVVLLEHVFVKVNCIIQKKRQRKLLNNIKMQTSGDDGFSTFIKCLLGRLIIPRAMRVDKRALALRDIV